MPSNHGHQHSTHGIGSLLLLAIATNWVEGMNIFCDELLVDKVIFTFGIEYMGTSGLPVQYKNVYNYCKHWHAIPR